MSPAFDFAVIQDCQVEAALDPTRRDKAMERAAKATAGLGALPFDVHDLLPILPRARSASRAIETHANGWRIETDGRSRESRSRNADLSLSAKMRTREIGHLTMIARKFAKVWP